MPNQKQNINFLVGPSLCRVMLLIFKHVHLSILRKSFSLINFSLLDEFYEIKNINISRLMYFTIIIENVSI